MPFSAGSFFRPVPHRDFPAQRWVRIGVRTWHLIAMGLLLGATAQGLPPAALPWAWGMTAASGAVFVALELYGSGVWLLQLKGWAVLLKIVLLLAAWSTPDGGLDLLLLAVVIGGISSHMPGKYRYFSPLHGRVIKE